MDPNETLRRLRQLAEYGRQLERPDAAAGDGYGGYTWRQLAHEQAELFQALDEWLMRGGFAPKAWQLLDVQWRDVVGGPPEPLGGPVPGVDGAHLPDVGTWTGDPGTPEYKAETERRIDRYLGRNPDE